ncbi:MAG: TlpA disulfide reductase family protein [Bacteroidota bacterium]
MKLPHNLIWLGIFLALLWPQFSSAQSSVQLRGTLTECPDTLLFFEMDGISLRPLAAIPLQKTEAGSSFQVTLQEVEEGIYFLGQGGPQTTRPLYLGAETNVSMQGSCPQLKSATLTSRANEDLREINEEVRELSQEFQGQIRRYRQALKTKQGVFAIEQEMRQTDQKKQALYDSVGIQSPFLAQMVGVKTYLSYQNNGSGYQDESRYFAEEYFRFTKLDDPSLNRLPDFHEAVKTYARNVSSLRLSAKAQIQYGEALLGNIPAMGSAYKSALTGLSYGFQGRTDLAYVTFAERYLEEFPKENPKIRQQFEQQILKAKAKMIGSVAPEISLKAPNGDTLNLSDYRGKVVLIDFWASWCGPCRRENPKVVAMYEKYKDQGFEIFAVSLDKSKKSWEAAIQKDGLLWPQVSDLRGWRSSAAQTYGVSSIPYTVLLDQEGKIVAKKLRGKELSDTVGRLLQKGAEAENGGTGK